MVDTEFSELARQLDAKLTEGATPGSLKQLLARGTVSRRTSPRVRPPVLVALGVVVGVVASAITFTPDATPEDSLAVAPVVTPVEAALGDCVRPGAEGVLELPAACTWQSTSPALEVVSMGNSRLRVEGEEVFVLDGWVVFDVDPVREGPPVRIGVSEGTIEVIGTRFSVYQDHSRGHVELVEGRIRWLPRSVGEEVADPVELDPGDRFAWGAPSRSLATGVAEGEAQVAQGERAGAGEPGRAPKTPKSIDDIGRLRAKGRYLEALVLARDLARKTRDPRTREVLHYEAGTLIEGPLGDAGAACEHWREHLSRYPTGRYAESVTHRLARLECGTAVNASL